MTQVYFLGCDDSWQQLQHASTEAAQVLRLPQALDSLTAALAAGDSAQVLYSQPQRSVASGLASMSLSDAIAQWQREINQLLSVQRRYRRAIKLYCLDEVVQSAPQGDTDASLLSLLGKLSATKPALVDLLAQAALTAPECKQLTALLQASTVPAVKALTVDVPAYVAEYLQLCQHSAQLPQLQQQQQQLHVQLELVQQELEVVFAEKQQMQLKLAPLQAQVEQALAATEHAKAEAEQTALKLAAEQQQSKQLKDENDLLILQLMQVQEELEKYYLQYKQQNAELEKNASETTKLKAELAALNSQLSQHKALAEQQKAQAEQQKAQAGQQIAQLQQQHTNAQRDATAKQNNLAMLQKQAERELGKALAEIDKLQRQLAGASLTGQQAIAELKTVKSSTMWKAMAPVRKLSSAAKKKQLQLQKDISLVRSCALFDTDWYLQSYPDVEQSGADPIAHYLQYGAKEGRAPGPDFDGNWYLSHYPDVASSGVNPLVHFIKFGQLEGRQTSPKLLQLKNSK